MDGLDNHAPSKRRAKRKKRSRIGRLISSGVDATCQLICRLVISVPVAFTLVITGVVWVNPWELAVWIVLGWMAMAALVRSALSWKR